jgi:uncharacterized protein YecE (DUF72 family)
MRPETYQTWYDETPEGFVFSVKGGRYITHLKRLQGVDSALANFFASGVLRLREKLGPFLWQLPPQLGFDEQRMRAFFALLPKSTKHAAALAQRHDQRLSGRSETRALVELPLRHALEVRHRSFLDPAFIALLREYDIAACVADSAKLYPCIRDVTADFVYVRLHGATELYTSGYGPNALSRWAKQIQSWLRGGSAPRSQLVSTALPPRTARDVFVYFDNDVKVRAPFDALNLQRLLNGERTKRPPRTLTSVSETPLDDWTRWRKLGSPPA